MKVFFCPDMVADSGGYSPSAGKPSQAVASWLEHGFDVEVVPPAPVSIGQLCAVHDPDFVTGVLSGVRANGFGNKSALVAESLPFTSGAMLSAAREAIATGGVACAPVSGFHHAGYARASGFCTFNGLAVTAAALIESDAVQRVGILDCDMHYGDGTDEILQSLPWLDHRVTHWTSGRRYHSPDQADAFLRGLPSVMTRFMDCDVLLYQAGADPHIDDPLGGYLTTEQLRERDRIVFAAAKRMGLPVAWNLAGGYQRDAEGGIRPVLDVHDNTMREALAVIG